MLLRHRNRNDGVESLSTAPPRQARARWRPACPGSAQTSDRLIGLILLGNNLVNFLAVSVATLIAIRLMGDLGLALVPFVLTPVILVFAESPPRPCGIASGTHRIPRRSRSRAAVARLLPGNRGNQLARQRTAAHVFGTYRRGRRTTAQHGGAANGGQRGLLPHSPGATSRCWSASWTSRRNGSTTSWCRATKSTA